MTSALLNIPMVMTAAELERRQEHRTRAAWTLETFAGQLVEVRAVGASPLLTFAARLILDAQRHSEPVAWVSASDELFYPPDFAQNGIDLDALGVVRTPDAQAAAVAADKLLRCGAFGLLVLDLGDDPWFPDALQNRLGRHAEQNNTAVVCLTRARTDRRALGSLVSVRAEVHRVRDGAAFRCIARGERDRQHRPGWTYEEVCSGTPGML